MKTVQVIRSADYTPFRSVQSMRQRHIAPIGEAGKDRNG